MGLENNINLIPEKYANRGTQIGKLVDEKQKAYGDSFHQSCKIIEVLYPHGIPVPSYKDALSLIRVIDKMFRIANDKGYGGESPWGDIAGYSLLSIDEGE